MAEFNCLANLNPEAFSAFVAAKNKTLETFSALSSDLSFVAVNGVYDYPSRIPGFGGDVTKSPSELLVTWTTRFTEIENNIKDSLSINRTETMRDFILTATGYAQYFGASADKVLSGMTASTMITLNGFTDTIKNAAPEHFLQMSDAAFTNLNNSVLPSAVAASEQAISQLNSKLLSNEIIADAINKLKVEKKDFFENLGFNGCVSL